MPWLHASNPLHDLVLRIAGEKYRNLVQIALLWETLVGKLLAERSFVSRIEQKTLFVGVTNSIWLQELVLLKEPILEKIRQHHIETIEEIVFYTKVGKTNRQRKDKKL